MLNADEWLWTDRFAEGLVGTGERFSSADDWARNSLFTASEIEINAVVSRSDHNRIGEDGIWQGKAQD